MKYSPYQHIIESQQFDQGFLKEVFELSEFAKKHPGKMGSELSGKLVALMFYETSTRTRMSFESAALRLGAGTIHTENARDFSSVSKGESLEDSIKVVSNYCDFLILRHNEDNSSRRAVRFSSVPLINGGSGSEQHPTQALLDVFTIFQSFRRLENLKIGVVGDLLHGRTCSSLVYLLSKYANNKFYFVSPENCKLFPDLKEHLQEDSIEFEETDDLNRVLPEIDVLYMTRIQKERFESPLEYEKAKGNYILDSSNIDRMPEKSVVMHPLPRVDEIHPEIDENPRSRYFLQVENGVYTRMALLKILNDHL